MRPVLKTVLLVASFILAVPAFAGDRGTPEDAVALVQKVIAYIKANGKDKAIAAVNSQKQFIDRDLYISIGDTHGMSFANGGNPKMAGKNLLEMKDVEGKAFVKEGVEMGRTMQTYWVDYKFPNPVTKQIEQKSMYSEKIGDIVVSCAVYKG